jgi:hypothetical protein
MTDSTNNLVHPIESFIGLRSYIPLDKAIDKAAIISVRYGVGDLYIISLQQATLHSSWMVDLLFGMVIRLSRSGE